MKIVILLLLGLSLVGTAAAQAPGNPERPASSQSTATATDPPGVTVTQFKWEKTVFVPALYEDPMRVNQDSNDLRRDQKAAIRDNGDRMKQGQTPVPIPNKKIEANAPVGDRQMGVPLGDEAIGNGSRLARPDPGASSVSYLYEAKIKNTGVKTIRAIIWAYSLVDADTGVEVGNHRFKNSLSLRSGRDANLVGRSANTPTHVVQIKKSGKDVNGKYTERVVFDRIEYEDGSFWQRSPG